MLYDHTGRPIKKTQLGQQQAAPQVAGVRTYADLAPAGALSPSRLARLLRDAAQGQMTDQAALFEDMEEKDSHIFSEISKRKRAVSGRPWLIQPADDTDAALKQAAFCREALNSLQVEDLLFHILDAVGKGFSCLELIWDISSGQAAVTQAKHRPQQWFGYHPERPEELRLLDATYAGEQLIPGKWLVHTHPAKSGNPRRQALYRTLAWLFLFRNYSTKAWIQFVESYGLPLRIGKYPQGSTEEDKQVLLDAVSAIATEAGVTIPDGMEIDIVEQAKTGNAQPHKEFLEWSAKEVSKAVLGATLTSDSYDKGARSLGDVHNQVRLDIMRTDARQIMTTINQQLVKPLVDLNFGPQGTYPGFYLELPDSEDKTALAERLSNLNNMGFGSRIPVAWLHKKFDIPEPEDGEQTLADVAPASPMQAMFNASRGRREVNAKTSVEQGQAPVDDLKQTATEDTQGWEDDMVRPVVEVLRQCNSLEEARSRVLDAWPDMNADNLGQALAQAMFASELWGRAHNG